MKKLAAAALLSAGLLAFGPVDGSAAISDGHTKKLDRGGAWSNSIGNGWERGPERGWNLANWGANGNGIKNGWQNNNTNGWSNAGWKKDYRGDNGNGWCPPKNGNNNHAVPEPATMALLGAAIGAVYLTKRKTEA